MPLLGMALSWQEAADDKNPFGSKELLEQTRRWRTFWGAAPGPRELKEQTVDDGEAKIPSAHGCFDNAVHVMNRTLTDILGHAPKSPAADLHAF
jgi:hypothetical protein